MPTLLEIGLRHSEYFLNLLQEAGLLYKSGGEPLDNALRLYQANHENIEKGEVWAATWFSQSAHIAAMCMDYPGIAFYLLNSIQHPREHIQWREAALVAAQHLKDRQSEGEQYGYLGVMYADLGETERAIENYERAIAIAREVGDEYLEAHMVGNLGIAYQTIGDAQRAVALMEQGLAMTQKLGDRRNTGNGL